LGGEFMTRGRFGIKEFFKEFRITRR